MEESKGTDISKYVHPYKKANCFSKLYFVWLFPLLFRGYKTDLKEEDIYPILKPFDSEVLGEKLKTEWAKQVKNRNKQPSLWTALRKVFWKEMVILGIFYWFFETVVNLSQPLILSKVLQYYEPNSTMTLNEAYMYSGLMVLATFIPVMFHHNFVFRQFLLGRKIKVAASALVYEKALKLSHSSLADTTVGQMVNLISNDVGRFEQVTKFLQDLWVVPIQIITVAILVYFYVGAPGVAGFAMTLFFMPFQSWLGRKSSIYRLKTALRTDERIRLMNEILSGIQVIKMYTWEKPFAKLVEISRRNEIVEIKKSSIVRGVSMSFNLFLTRSQIYLGVLTYCLLGNTLTARYVFVLTSFYNIMTISLTFRFPQGAMQVAEACISIKRIREFLLYEEVDNHSQSPTDEHNIKDNNSLSKLTNNHSRSVSASSNRSLSDIILQRRPRILVNNVSVKWSDKLEESTLRNINMDLASKELAAIIGTVGSGKTTLLHAILKELPPVEGEVLIDGKISYASQEPWLFVGSVRQNITFGQPFDAAKYKEVIKVCALERDLTLFPYGDKTTVGERGVSLSGGQRARVNLARAVYKQADIYLLDDPLSAVDTHVGKHIFENCIKGYLKDKCVVLVTHQLQYLIDVKKIYLLDNGKIELAGTYGEIQLSNSVSFTKLLKQPKELAEDDIDTEQEIRRKSIDSTRKISLRKSSSQIQSLTKLDEEPMIEKEGRGEGKISWSVYKAYFGAGGNAFTISVVLTLCLITQAVCTSSDYFLTYWVNMEQLKQKDQGIEAQMNSTNNTSSKSSAPSKNSLQTFWINNMFENTVLITYTTIIVALVVLTLVRSVSFYYFCMRASKNLHKTMFDKIVNATMRFFNTNPSGRILNRFSMDMNQVDEILPVNLLDTIQNFLLILAIIIVIASVNPYMLIPTCAILVIFYFIRVFYMATARDMKRLEGTTRSPVYSHLTATLQGLTTIRAFGAEEMLKREFDVYQNQNSSAYFTFTALARCFGLWLDLHCTVFVALVTFSFLLFDGRSLGGNVGLAITQSITLTAMFQWGMRQWSELENTMTCVERIKEYADIEPEVDKDFKEPPLSWPDEGHVDFVDLSLRYAPGEALVLKNLTFTVRPREKIGIVGRTGAGKSSMISALFRLAHNEGKILIDGVDTGTLSLRKLRSSISIIPQEPVLFSGSLRKNLDPFDEYSDEALWSALAEVELKNAVSELPEGLQSYMSEGGSNFSVGQRQLVCLSRAIVRNNKILVLDEATANVDPQTDALIQNTIRKEFKNCTVFTVAHRLHTIMDSDKVLVMDAGRVKEFGHPHQLLQDRGMFYQMVQQTGKNMTENLTAIAKEAYDNMQEDRSSTSEN